MEEEGGEDLRIYISGGITNVHDYIIRFKKAEKDLYKRFGKQTVVYNPAEIASTFPEDMTHEEYMLFSFLEMDLCDAVYFLKGWEKSCGASQEMGYAIAKSMNIMFEKGE